MPNYADLVNTIEREAVHNSTPANEAQVHATLALARAIQDGCDAIAYAINHLANMIDAGR